MAANINGLIYYKLDANVHGFPGDITKNCGLRGEEIDGNFSFLRGHDIKSVSFDESGTMYLTRYNGEIISAKKTDTPEYDFNYNPETGSLTIVTPEGKEIVLSGFKVVTNVYHDYTLEGYGSQETPLEISNQGKTGRYRPAIKLIDMTAEDEDGKPLQLLPMENNTKHDRYVTKEKISRFGRLFPLSGVEKITKRLNDISSEWHVPTKEEWDEILNVIDCAKPEHNKTESNVDLGDFAGAALKATKYWNTLENGKMLSDDKFGFSIYPVGYCGNRGKEYYGSFGETSAFWTSTVEDNNRDMFVKTFDYNKETVGQRTWGENYYLSLRLVKKFDGNNFSDSESIDGFTSNCVHIPGTSLIWTKDNIAFSQEQYDGFTPKKWKEYENIESDDNSYEIRYFVNDWNGNGWDKHELKEGEGIVLFEGENGRMHEWLLVDGELIDTSVLLKTEFQDEIDYTHSRIDTEISDRENVDSQLWGAINNETERAQSAETQLWEGISKEAQAREEVDSQLWAAVNGETTRAQEVEGQLWTAINNESEIRKNTDDSLFEAINNETERAQSAETQLWEGISKEAQAREENDKQLLDAINGETTRAQEVEEQLWGAINNESVIREENDKQLWDALNNEIKTREEIDNQIWDSLNQEIQNRKDADDLLQQYIDENKVIPENNSVVIVPGETVDGKTSNTTIKVNLDSSCEHLKLGENGIYFDGYFGQF